MDRRQLFGLFTSGMTGAALALVRPADAAPRGAIRRHRRRVRRIVRRRIRRRVAIRNLRGRRVWVVPVGLVAGWELLHENQVVVVKETKFVVVDGERTEVAVVQHADGSTEQVEVAREDTAENRENLEGSVLPRNDNKTPGVSAEVEDEE
jgi:hypothetical protein